MEKLINLWMTEGFIQPIEADRTLENLARDCFNDLHSRFLFQECKGRGGAASNQIRYEMHDLIHDLTHFVSKDICFHWKHDPLNHYPLFGNACHLSFLHNSIQPLDLKATQRNERLRTFLLMGKATECKLDPQLFSHLRYLRVLGLAHAGLNELVDSIDQLKYLRYLNLSDNPIQKLPKSMCKLVALQVLKLRDCPKLRDLPEDISSLFNLRHIDLDIRSALLTCMPPCFSKLTDLQYLSVYVVTKKNGCGIEELEKLNCLHETLCIKNIDLVTINGAAKANLALKKSLKKLELQWRSRDEQVLEQFEVLKELKPHKDLKELVIRDYCGIAYPNWLSDSSHAFTSIHLEGLKYCSYLPSMGELPFLKSFVISDMPCLELIDHIFYGGSNAVKFRSLKSFELNGMSNLTRWEDASGTSAGNSAMPCLERFTLYDCAVLVSLPQNLLSDRLVKDVMDCPLLQP